MAIVRIQLPTVNLDPMSCGRPSKCPRCENEILQRWGIVSKPLRDTEWEEVQVYRYRCTNPQCKHIFRWYTEGVDRADMSQRLRCLAGLAWSMGLSLRGVGIIFSAFGEGLRIGRMSVWRAVQEKAKELDHQAKSAQRKHKVRVLGVDGAWIRLKGETTGVMVAVDMGNGQMVSMEVVDEHDPQAGTLWVVPVAQTSGTGVGSRGDSHR